MAQAFQVDLRGLVDLLSHHLYSGPAVYVRELLQNAVDAVTARRSTDATAPARVTVIPADVAPDGRLSVTDTGTGLTTDQVEEFLATIGRSSKRDDLGFARQDLLGQFGIGLLSCFLVTDEIELVTRAGPRHPVVVWTGRADGSYETVEHREPPADLLDRLPTDGMGTVVTLTPAAGRASWLESSAVLATASRYGALLPYPVEVALPDGTARDVTVGTAPWERIAEPVALRAALHEHARTVLGVEAFDVLTVSVPEAGLRGMAAVLGGRTSAGARPAHRVAVKHMLLGDAVPDLLPRWAFFVRCSVDSALLRPTASREALYDDELLETVRVSLGAQVADWLQRLAVEDPSRMGEFLDLHRVGVLEMALQDDDMLRLVDRWMPFETSLGRVTLERFRRTHPQLRYTARVEDFRQIAAVATAQGIGVVNAGYVHEAEVVERLPTAVPGTAVRKLDPVDLQTQVDVVADDRLLAVRPALATVREALHGLGVEVELRAYDPATLAALYLDSRDARHRRASRETARRLDPVWADILGDLDDGGEDRPLLLLNDRSPVLRQLLTVPDRTLLGLGAESLYCQALLQGHHPLRPLDAATLNRSFAGLLDWALRPGGGR